MGRKSQEEKEFLISSRKKIGPGVTNAPVWVLQKAGRRIWNKKAKRHWRETGLGRAFKKKLKEQGKTGKKVRSGKKYKSRMFKTKGQRKGYE
ncbi:MAG: hypothetical protein HY544_03020 [Candidatus Diapherotrites archaeon]|uniref:50S ribosomal protein L39e n=1 Tax=Candidatus Iainarchaeum sp. TaxID=3101447 RepID=A0A8T3YKX9_9ARCH|nr:hypothetical protein [Candidatus Diapherotrites archaeon]